MNVRRITRAVALLMVILVAEPVWMLAAVAAPQLPDPGKVPMTKQEQEQIGQKAMGEVYQQMPVLPDSSPVTQYIQQLGRKLQAQIPQQYSWPYQFHVVQEKDINAFALPGGPIFVNVGTITAAANEAQLAGVLAHEMSHVYMQHSIKGAVKQQEYGTLGAILGALGQAVGGIGGAVAQLGGQIGAGVLSLRYSRGDEAQADAVGAIIMWKANYDPKQMAIFFQTLEKEAGNGGPQFLSDHPNPGNRVTAVQKEIQNWPQKQYIVNSAQFDQVRNQARSVQAYTAEQIGQMAKSGQIHNTGMPAGTAPAAQASMGNVAWQQVAPSGNWQTYNQNGITFQFPSNWQVASDQQGLTIAPQAGVANGSIAYGVAVSSFTPQGANSLDQAVQQLVSGMQQQNPGMQANGNPQSIRVNGMDARSVELSSQSPIQRSGRAIPERDWLVAIGAPNGEVFYMIFVAPQQDFGKLQNTYSHMLKTFHFTGQ
ncbi:MAG TPA: M48 family metalloprotease [Terriglobales bacterium]|nr:M48 family metalloprotease [Terriglobales bacterium]